MFRRIDLDAWKEFQPEEPCFQLTFLRFLAHAARRFAVHIDIIANGVVSRIILAIEYARRRV